tara:strand:- start:2135 stop:2425 length:291 start_codon:yes stop_codon:yes gene_type:complete
VNLRNKSIPPGVNVKHQLRNPSQGVIERRNRSSFGGIGFFSTLLRKTPNKEKKRKTLKKKRKENSLRLIGMFGQAIFLDSWACMPHISGFRGFSST